MLLEININNIITSEEKFIFLSTIVLPIIAQELLCTYISYKTSLLPSIIYKFVIKLYIFIIPIVPNLGDYIYSAINIIYPYIIYMILSRTFNKYEKVKGDNKKANITVFSVPLILGFIFLIILVSGLFKYKMIAIATNSMVPSYGRGDAVIYKKVSSEEIEVGDILVFEKDNRIITHRVTKKWISNNKYHFNTKGDNNNGIDSFAPSSDDILGKVTFSIKYIGYPTVIVSEFFERSK